MNDTTYHAFGPTSKSSTILDTMTEAIRQHRRDRGDNGPLTVALNPADMTGVQSALGIELVPNPYVVRGTVYVVEGVSL